MELTKEIAGALLSLLVVAAAATASTPAGGAQRGASSLTIQGSASTATALYPGSSGDVTIVVSNPNAYPVTVTSVSLDGLSSAITADVNHPDCITTGVTFVNATRLSIVVPAHSRGASSALSGAVAMSNASVNGCQGAEFSIPVVVKASAA